MFTILKDYINPHQRSRGHKRVPTTYLNEKNERLPLVPFKPSYINVRFFAAHRDCARMIKENPWLSDVRMFENPELTEQLVKADYETLTIELSSEALQQDISMQRDIFIRAICSFIAQRLFHDVEQGQPYRLLVQRYSTKAQQIELNNLKNKTKH